MPSDTIKNHEPLPVSQFLDPGEYFEIVFSNFLQGWFGHEEYIQTGMHWLGKAGSSDDSHETSELIITAKKPTIDDIEKTPHLTIVVGPLQWSGIGLDQMQETKMSSGERIHTDLVPGTVGFHCQAKSGMLARRLAWHASLAVLILRRLIMRVARVHHIATNPSISGETSPGAIVGPSTGTDVVEVVTAVSFYAQPRWRITTPAPVLRGIRAELAVRSRRTMDPDLSQEVWVDTQQT